VVAGEHVGKAEALFELVLALDALLVVLNAHHLGHLGSLEDVRLGHRVVFPCQTVHVLVIEVLLHIGLDVVQMQERVLTVHLHHSPPLVYL